MIIKERNNVTLEIKDVNFEHAKRGFVITDHNAQGDVCALPVGTNWKRVNEMFCLMNNYSVANKRLI